MPEHGRLLLFEAMLTERVLPGDRVVGRDLSMLVMTGGRERTEAEYRALFAAAGFDLAGVAPAGPTHVVEARPVR